MQLVEGPIRHSSKSVINPGVMSYTNSIISCEKNSLPLQTLGLSSSWPHSKSTCSTPLPPFTLASPRRPTSSSSSSPSSPVVVVECLIVSATCTAGNASINELGQCAVVIAKLGEGCVVHIPCSFFRVCGVSRETLKNKMSAWQHCDKDFKTRSLFHFTFS